MKWPWEENNPEEGPPLAEPEKAEKVRYGNQFLSPNHPYITGIEAHPKIKFDGDGIICIKLKPLWPTIKGLMSKSAKGDFAIYRYDDMMDDLVAKGICNTESGYLEITIHATSGSSGLPREGKI